MTIKHGVVFSLCYHQLFDFTTSFLHVSVNTGSGLYMSFDLGVWYESFDDCDDMFSNAEVLGDGAACKWISPRDLFIIIGKGDNLIEIGKLK